MREEDSIDDDGGDDDAQGWREEIGIGMCRVVWLWEVWLMDR
jgi:hypothetical protein